jgi:hypothetical protein
MSVATIQWLQPDFKIKEWHKASLEKALKTRTITIFYILCKQTEQTLDVMTI